MKIFVIKISVKITATKNNNNYPLENVLQTPYRNVSKKSMLQSLIEFFDVAIFLR